ncbi:NEQ012 [Nanoarchaeum equitans Kin4-M]|uniref:NEQ012 n=1 Tax=Nanoarchaeum equitans (strain Kin4-M) TaxID=228908 RepID=Q74MF2_NANEQ|nr:NEQ012 [Nanoarchaeum equitans Kin4-M]
MKKIAVFVPHSIYPNFGGAVRCYELLKRLDKRFRLIIFSLSEKFEIKRIWDNSILIEYPKGILPTIMFFRIVKQFNPDLVIVEYTSIYSFFPTIIGKLYGKPVILDAHNVEYVFKRGRLPSFLLPLFFLNELLLSKLSDILLVVSKLDKKIFELLYNIDRIVVIPNGVNPDRFSNNETKSNCAVFHGDYNYDANREAINFILDLAKELPEIEFVIFGRDTNKVKPKSKNVKVLGEVAYEEIPRILQKCKIAVVPLFRGSGTSLKILEYLSAGLTIVATKIAVRGLPLKEGTHYYKAETEEEFVEKIKYALEHPTKQYSVIEFSWDNISKKLIKTIEKVINVRTKQD